MARPRSYDDGFRSRLIDAAAALLAAEGPHALSTRRLAAEVGASTGAIYRLLGSKEELLRAMYVEGFRRLMDHQQQVPEDLAPLDRLRRLAHAYQDAALASPHLYVIMFERPVAEFSPSADDVAFALSTLQMVVDAVAAARAAGDLPPGPDDPATVATRLWAANHGITSLALAGMIPDGGATPRQHLDAIVELLLVGLGPAPATTTHGG